ncbi:MAG TPA: hypothetical protein VNZ52_13535 [Candidatus Thermoplasmatota archaeon]|nr:hypothetical protein [Candidatus Thermoplasmatota archaeon]
MGPQVAPAPLQAAARVAVRAEAAERRDWGAWYDALETSERRALRDRLLHAPFEEVRADPELRSFFLYHTQDLSEDAPPGSARLRELRHIVDVLLVRADPEGVEQRRKACAFLFAEYQAFLRDNPWAA